MKCKNCNNECFKASCRNHRIVTKIIRSVNDITGHPVKPIDIGYIKYQLLKQDNSYELSSMNEDDFNKRIKAIIGG
jgi:hypothetical protein